jgi:hypothetical protein
MPEALNAGTASIKKRRREHGVIALIFILFTYGVMPLPRSMVKVHVAQYIPAGTYGTTAPDAASMVQATIPVAPSL